MKTYPVFLNLCTNFKKQIIPKLWLTKLASEEGEGAETGPQCNSTTACHGRWSLTLQLPSHWVFFGAAEWGQVRRLWN